MWTRRTERGERCLAGVIGEDGGERPWRDVRAVVFFRTLVGVVSRAAREGWERDDDELR
jgi:hypothetical protein